jgi:uncharacterized protein YkwD
MSGEVGVAGLQTAPETGMLLQRVSNKGSAANTIMKTSCLEALNATGRRAAAILAAVAGVLLPLCSQAQLAPVTADARPPQAPPTAPPIRVAKPQSHPIPQSPPPEGATPYSIGQPTDEEQQYLEYLNQARANPPAEGVLLANTTDPNVLSAYAYFSVDLSLMESQFDVIAASPPLAMNAELMTAARLHSGDMFTNEYQGHTGTNGSSPGDRITAQGYIWSTYGENVFAYSYSVFYGHAAFEVDWGGTSATGGMQSPPGHRENIHNSAFREVGVGVVDGTNGSVGPQLVTQDFGATSSGTPFLTGVVYYDLNGNGFYAPGEGIGGVTVQAPGSTYFAVTANSGGYTIPVTTNGNYTIIFSGAGFTTTQQVVTVSGLANVKVDFVPAYSPPVVKGSNPAGLNERNAYAFNAIGGATNYEWMQTYLAPYTLVEDAANGLANLTVISSGTYSVITNSPGDSGNYCFHLAQPDAKSQYLILKPTLVLATNSQLTFAKELGTATSDQVAHAQISTNGGLSWVDLWVEAGGGAPDSSFITITNSLGAYAGLPAQFQFAWEFTSGSYFPQTDPDVGLCLNDIAFSNAEQTEGSVTNSIPGTSLVFVPTNAGVYQLSARAMLPGRVLPWGPVTQVTASNLPPVTIQFTGSPSRSGNQVQAVFNAGNYRNGMPLQVLTATDPGGPWTTDALASVQTVVSNSQFRLTTTNAGSRAYYRIRGN